MENNIVISTHPYEPYIPDNATKLIIGSIPPQRFCIKHSIIDNDDVKFYYGSKDNNFWKLIGEVTKEKFTFKNNLEAIKERKEWLLKNNIGITDIIEVCEHVGGKATDEALKIIKYKEIDSILIKHNQIKTLICTSYFVIKYLKRLLKEKMNAKYHIDKKDKRKGYISIDGIKKYEIIILYSPSRLALRGMGPNGKDIRKKQYQDAFEK